LLVALASFAAAVGIVLLVRKVTGLNLFTVMGWGVIPVGAFVTGLVAASGYYFGAKGFHVKPSRAVAVGMLLVAALVQVSLYYVQYFTAVTEEGLAIRQFVSFPHYVGFMLSHARYGFVAHGLGAGGAAGVTMGAWGYFVAAIQFLALVAGGWIIYAVLADEPYCAGCAKYLATTVKVKLPFAGDLTDISGLRGLEPLSVAYFQRLGQLPPGNTGALELELYACPRCKREALCERPTFVKRGKMVHDVAAYRTSWHKEGASVAHEVGSLRPAAAVAAA
jgi:hypothetical protein